MGVKTGPRFPTSICRELVAIAAPWLRSPFPVAIEANTRPRAITRLECARLKSRYVFADRQTDHHFSAGCADARRITVGQHRVEGVAESDAGNVGKADGVVAWCDGRARQSESQLELKDRAALERAIQVVSVTDEGLRFGFHPNPARNGVVDDGCALRAVLGERGKHAGREIGEGGHVGVVRHVKL